MIATVSYIQQKFDEFNKLIFDGELPRIPIVQSKATRVVGAFTCKVRKNFWGKKEYADLKLRISTQFDLPENELEDVIIHEMIHYYIVYHKLNDSSSHGPLFKQLMNDINAKFGRHITVSHKSPPEQREQLAAVKKRWHVIAVVTFKDGKTGIKVLPRILPRILYYYNTVKSNSGVANVALYMSNNIFFNRYPNSSALKVHYLDKTIIEAQIQDAEKLHCNGVAVIKEK